MLLVTFAAAFSHETFSFVHEFVSASMNQRAKVSVRTHYWVKLMLAPNVTDCLLTRH